MYHYRRLRLEPLGVDIVPAAIAPAAAILAGAATVLASITAAITAKRSSQAAALGDQRQEPGGGPARCPRFDAGRM